MPVRESVRRAVAPGLGRIQTEGDAETARVLAAALEATREKHDTFTHGFHSYPARMHPETAHVLLDAFAAPNTRVLDPFCGSGTVLVEAMVAGCKANGVDLNPLAVRIAAQHCALRDREARRRFEHTLARVTEASLERVRNRVKARAPLTERNFYDPHVLLELAGLRDEIHRVEGADDREALEMVFSALLVKFSRQRADTAEQELPRRIRKGLVSEFFERKGRELSERWAAFARACPRDVPPPRLHVGDARQLPRVLGKGQRYGLVISSPPYGGTYDYVDHHARRYAWLGIDASALAEGEVGSRRGLSQKRGALDRWDREVHDCLASIAALCKRGAPVILLVGDAEVGGGLRIDATDQLLRLGPRAGLEPVAAASHARPDFRGGPNRREHLVFLERKK